LIQAALLGGVFIGVVSALPVISILNYCCCAWILVGGALAAYLDQAPGRPNNVARGALDGLLAAIVGAFIWIFASMAVDVVMAPIQERLVSAILDGPADLPPAVRDVLQNARGNSPVAYVVGFMLHLIAGCVFGTLGGLFGALFFWREDLPPALGGPHAPPPIPPPL
jgi:hypothetical protein